MKLIYKSINVHRSLTLEAPTSHPQVARNLYMCVSNMKALNNLAFPHISFCDPSLDVCSPLLLCQPHCQCFAIVSIFLFANYLYFVTIHPSLLSQLLKWRVARAMSFVVCLSFVLETKLATKRLRYTRTNVRRDGVGG